MKIGVVGAGAVGGFFGSLLQKAGHEVTFLARGKHLEAMLQKGLLVKGDERTFTVKGTFTDDLQQLSDAELILFCVKSNETQLLAYQLSSVIQEDTPIITMQNGVDNEEILTHVFGSKRVFSCATYVQSTLEMPGVVKQQGRVKLVIGVLDDSANDQCKSIVESFQTAGIDTTFTTKIMERKWKKFLWNVTFNPLSAVSLAKVGEILDDAPLRKTAESICKEAMAIAKKFGISLDMEETMATIFSNAERAREHKTSMLQDRLNGKQMEVEAMCGYLLRKAEEMNIHVPAIQMCYSVLNFVNNVQRN